MVWIQLTERLIEILSKNESSELLLDEIEIDSAIFMPHRSLIRKLRTAIGLDEFIIAKSLKECRIHYSLPASKKEILKEEERRMVYQRFMQQFKDAQEEREYLEGVKGLNRGSGLSAQIQDDTKEWKQVQKHLSGVVNVLFSVAAVFTGCFYLGELAHLDLGIRVLLSLLAGFIVAFAEGWFFTKDLLASPA